MVKLNARPHKKPGTHPLQSRKHNQTNGGSKGYYRQGGKIVARQDLVVDLKHVDGKGQLQQVDEHAEKEPVPEIKSAGDQKVMHI